MKKKRKETLGELAYKTAQDKSKFDPYEIGWEMGQDLLKNVLACAQNHESIFDEDEYCVVVHSADDILIKGITRRKFYAFLFLPKPRPRQIVFLYNKRKQTLKRLWSLPDAITMATLSQMTVVRKDVEAMKYWCDLFYEGWAYDSKTNEMYNRDPLHFFRAIRKQSGISLLSEQEYLQAHREELRKALGNQVSALGSDPVDETQVFADKIIDACKPRSDQEAGNAVGQV